MRWILIVLVALLMGNGYDLSQKTGYDKTITHKNNKTDQNKTSTKNESTLVQKPKSNEVKPASNNPTDHANEKLSLERQLVKYTRQLARFTKWLVIVTAVLALITAGLIWMAYRQEKHTKTIERAYVQMSHVTSKDNFGLQLFDETRAKLAAYINVKNYGNTPARVIQVFMTHRVLLKGEALPDPPDYSKIEGRDIPEEPIEAFLVKGGDFNYYYAFLVPPEDLALLNEKEKVLFIYGFVAYMDQFDRRYLGGYARRYRPNVEINNLVFVSHPKYNYDKEQ